MQSLFVGLHCSWYLFLKSKERENRALSGIPSEGDNKHQEDKGHMKGEFQSALGSESKKIIRKKKSYRNGLYKDWMEEDQER